MKFLIATLLMALVAAAQTTEKGICADPRSAVPSCCDYVVEGVGQGCIDALASPKTPDQHSAVCSTYKKDPYCCDHTKTGADHHCVKVLISSL
ncbi:hypothetical protein VHEMI09161 [[Torrubiella] hemipterigena]|uniref:Hydrophobin n=1 Tax=[Torrubiella] hemipterigena TaxID=1531966 RepID=A0A0A1TPU4_9HYPO|nr:hypothetical protein VHEMI09161 [[Torrubiella] hemipterigena]